MTSNERVKRAIRFNNPDRVPIIHSYQASAIIKYGENLQEIFRKYPSDFRYSDEIDLSLESLSGNARRGEWKDEWDCVWLNIHEGLAGQVKVNPLADWKNFKNYRFPDPEEVFDFEKEKRKFEQYDGKRFILGGWHIIFERLHFVRGYENVLIDLTEGSKELKKLADGIFEHNVKSIKEWFKIPVDGISFADDWGTQTALMISPDIWRSFFKPYYKELFSMVHKEGRYVYFHSDGYIIDIIPDLIEIGVDILNPQFSCHNLEELGKITSKKVCICADIDRQYLLPLGTCEEIKENVKDVIRIFGVKSNGGLIGRAEISDDVPIENADAVYRTFYEEGVYSKWV